MAIEIVPYTAEHIQNVRDFNARMVAGGEGDYQLPRDLSQFEKSVGTRQPWEGWLAMAGGQVRGGYLLRRQEFRFGAESAQVAFYNLSPSEGSIDKAYAPVSMKMLTTLMAREKLVFALGMGGVSKRLPQFLKALGWKLHEIPFFFRAVRPGRVLRNISALRTSPVRAAVADVAAFSGAATVGLGGLQAWKRFSGGRARSGGRVEVVPDFGDWADDLWQRAGDRYGMIGVRDSEALHSLYPSDMPRLSRLRVWRGSTVAGWVVVRHTKMEGHKQFGNLQVGTLVDGLALPEDVPLLAEAAERFLEGQGVDIVISNQSHAAWVGALRDRGYFTAPTNYVMALTKGLVLRVPDLSTMHITRGDGDGPIHL